LLLVAVALVIYMIATRRKKTVVVPVQPQTVSQKLPEVVQPPKDDAAKVDADLKDLEKSYDELESMIKSFKSKKV